jgi:lipopolysaccharide export system permease protein
MILAKHLSRVVFLRILAVALVLGGLALALDLVESAAVVLDAGDGGMARYIILRAPLILTVVLPVASIIGPVLAFLSLSGHNEFIIFRAAGTTTYRILGALVPLAIVLGGCMYLLTDRVAPRMEAALINWLDEKPTGGAGSFWARTTTGVIRAAASSPSGDVLVNVDIFETNRAGRMTARTDARVARYAGGAWTLEDATRLTPGQSQTVDISGQVWETPLSPANVRALATPGRSIAGDIATKMLEGDWAGNRSETFYQVRLYRGYAAWAVPLLMILLAAPAAFGMRRSGGFGKGAVWSVVLGFGFLLTDGMLASLGETGNMPPLLAAFGALALFSAIGGWMLVSLEE